MRGVYAPFRAGVQTAKNPDQMNTHQSIRHRYLKTWQLSDLIALRPVVVIRFSIAIQQPLCALLHRVFDSGFACACVASAMFG